LGYSERLWLGANALLIFVDNLVFNIAVVMRLLISSRYKLPFRLLANPANGTYL
jgi:hypothetical protein